MTTERIRAPKRIKGTRDVVVKVIMHLAWCTAKFLHKNVKKIEKRTMNERGQVASVTTVEYKYDVTCHALEAFTTLAVPSSYTVILGTYALFLRPARSCICSLLPIM